jgi:uncharacterized protein (DUF885 family)
MTRRPRVLLACAALVVALDSASAESSGAAVNQIADEYVSAQQELARASANTWPEEDSAARARRHEREDRWRAALRQIDARDLVDRPEWMTHGMLLHALDSAVALRACRSELWAVNQLNGWHLVVGSAATGIGVGSPDERRDALRLFGQLPSYVPRRIDDLRTGVKTGYTASRDVVQRVIAQIDDLLSDNASGPLVSPPARTDDREFTLAWRRLIDDDVRPALTTYRSYLATEYLPIAREAPGLAALPHGAACYAAQVLRYASLDVDPPGMSATSAQEVRVLEHAMAPFLARLFPNAPESERVTRLRNDPASMHTSRDEMLTAVRTVVERARAVLPQWFVRTPDAPLEVVPAPSFSEQSGAPGAYFASTGPGQPARLVVNTYRPEAKPRFEITFLAVHEGWPGHHFERIYPSATLPAHPVVRQLAVPAFREGWAFYAEWLGAEAGLFPTDADRAGQLLHAIDGWLALQIDPGVHVHGWTRDRAIEVMMRVAGRSRSIAESYVDRHAATPGQLVSYMLGYREIRDLRRAAETALGPRFDAREFHDVILRDGPVTLAMLKQKVTRWIEGQQAKASPQVLH